MRTRLGLVTLLQASLLGFFGSSGHAQELPQGSRARLLLLAEQALQDARVAEARDAYLALWVATAEREHACMAGHLSFRMKDMPRAVELLNLCVVTAPKSTDATKDARAELAQARAEVAELRVRGPEGTEVILEGDRRGVVPKVIFVMPGSHVVEGRGADGEEAAVAVSAKAGETHVVELKLERPASRPNGWIIAGGAVSAAGLLGLGAALHVTWNAREHEAEQKIAGANGCHRLDRPECRDAQRALTGLDTMRAVSTAALIAGAGLATTTLVYTFFPRERVAVSTRVGTGITIEATW
ncbi:MAG TPA: hypothetical protein VLS89_17330 [Candidatus Nanopelagicales bacterium]|nr:hypothetical protein [Candidatus Nanopelagicales bacterium]